MTQPQRISEEHTHLTLKAHTKHKDPKKRHNKYYSLSRQSGFRYFGNHTCKISSRKLQRPPPQVKTENKDNVKILQLYCKAIIPSYKSEKGMDWKIEHSQKSDKKSNEITH